MWINGPFGVGKLALAADLVQALPGAVVADPEDTGSAVRSALRGHPREHRDYQLYPPMGDHYGLLHQLPHAYTKGVTVPMPCSTETVPPAC